MEFRAFTGLRNDQPVERFDPTDLAVAQNIDIDNSGAIARRAGYTLVNTVPAGAKHSLWASVDETIGLYVSGTVLYSITGTPLMTGLTAGLRMSYVHILDRVYFSNSVQLGVLENGAVRSWGLPVPIIPAVSLTVGNMPAGAYQYTMTYFRNDGQESGAALAGRIDVPDGGGLIFIMPASRDAAVVLKAIYLTAPNGDVLYQAMIVPNTQNSSSYTGDAKDLVLPLITQFLQAAPACHMLGYYRGQLYAAVGDTLYPSEEYAYELFNMRKGIPLNGRMTFFAAMDNPGGDGVFVGTDRSCGALVGKGPFDFEYVQKLNYGAIEGASALVDGSLYGDHAQGARMLPMWLTTRGICVGLSDMEIRNITRTRYRIAASGKGAAIFMHGPNKLILTSNL